MVLFISWDLLKNSGIFWNNHFGEEFQVLYYFYLLVQNIKRVTVILQNKGRTMFYGLRLPTNIFYVLVSHRQRHLGSCEIAKKGIQKALAAETTSLG